MARRFQLTHTAMLSRCLLIAACRRHPGVACTHLRMFIPPACSLHCLSNRRSVSWVGDPWASCRTSRKSSQTVDLYCTSLASGVRSMANFMSGMWRVTMWPAAAYVTCSKPMPVVPAP
jgi:hypothetical protein